MPATVMARNTANISQSSLDAPTLPPYTQYAGDVELAELTPTNSTASLDEAAREASPSSGPSFSPPGAFQPTVQLQIQTEGKRWLSLPAPLRPDPIPVFSLTPDGRLHRPEYLSLRQTRDSGNCILVHGEDETETPLASTTYRFGPGKPPKLVLASPAGPDRDEEIEMTRERVFSRSQVVKTSLGIFQWRYAGSKERRPESADSLLVLERITPGEGRDGDGKSRAAGTPRERIAQLVRNDLYRTPGSSRGTAGNGGRLMLDLSGVDEKERDRLQVLVVATAIVMLKKEVDRRRMQQIAAMSAIASSAS